MVAESVVPAKAAADKQRVVEKPMKDTKIMFLKDLFICILDEVT